MVNYKLVYFNARGRTEVIRWIFEVADQKYEDFRFEREDWPKHKADAPFGQAPWLEIHDGSKIIRLPQSTSIARYLARKFNLSGKSDEEYAEADAFADQVKDIIAELTKHFRENDATLKAELEKKIAEEVWPNNLKIFENKLAQNNGWLVGDGMTWADMYFTLVLDWLREKKEATLASFPHCKALAEKVISNPKIAEWIKKRPVTAK